MRIERWLTTLPLRIRSLFRRERVESELDEELRYHLDRQIEEHVAAGMSEADARRAAALAMGGLEVRKEECRDARRVALVEDFVQDLRYGARALVKDRGLAIAAVASLALGIGANTALFTVVDATLLRSLPVPEPDRLVLFASVAPPGFSPSGYAGYDSTDEGGRRTMTSFPVQSARRMREQAGPALAHVFAYGDVGLNVNAGGRVDSANGQAVSGDYFAGLGVDAALGRTLADADDAAGASPAAVLGYRYWQSRFGGDPAVIGKPIFLNRVPFTVVGVTMPGFEGAMQAGSTVDVTIPIAWEPALYTDPKGSRMFGAGQWWLRVMGRLSPGATADDARAQLEAAFRQSIEERAAERAEPFANERASALPRLLVEPGGQGEMDERRRTAPSLYLLAGVVGLVLLVACANVANLLLSRAASRRREIGVRIALGARRGRLVRQLLTESLLLACLGGAAGVGFALWIERGLLAVADWGAGMRGLDVGLDWRVLAFTFGLSLGTGVVFGLAPARSATRVDLTSALAAGGRGAGGATRSRLSRTLVVFQVALSFVLLVGAGLFVRTLVNLRRVDTGFDARGVLLFGVRPEAAGYEGDNRLRLYERLAERLEAVPGVERVSFSRVPLLARVRSTHGVYLRDAFAGSPDAGGTIPPDGQCNVDVVRENFLETMRIPLLAGRTLDERDGASAPRVAVVNRAFAETYFPGRDPVGERFAFGPEAPDRVEIVGLVADAKYARQREDAPPTAYVPWRQETDDLGRVTFELRTAGDPSTLAGEVRRAAREIDENLPLDDVRTQLDEAERTLASERLFARLVTLFGLVAQLLAAVGLFGVLAYAVSRRTGEIGIRMALGADRRDVLREVLREGMTLALAGVGAGIAVALALTRLADARLGLSRMLYGVDPSDVATYASVAATLALVALAACWVPARRATKVDPLVALRRD